MRDVSQAFVDAIRQDTVQICELFEFTLRNSNTYYYCTHDEDLDWGSPSKRYYSAPIQRTVIDSNMNLEVDRASIKLSGITGQLFDIVNKPILDGVYVVIKRALWAEGTGMEFTVFAGTGNVSFDRNEIDLPITSILNTLNIGCPRNIFQQPCNYSLFDTGCTLNQTDYKSSSTASSDSVNEYTIIDAAFTVPVGDPNKYSLGEVHITSGNNTEERRMIIFAVDGLITLAVPLSYKMEAGDTYDYYPGCDGTPEICRDRFSNEENFYGFVYLPAAEESM